MMRTPKNQGFTLIEMIVSVGLFSIVIVIVGTAYLNLVNLDARTRATSDAINNLSFAMDTISRSLRTGTQYECGGHGNGPNCWPDPSNKISFINDQNQYVTYFLDTSVNQIKECVSAVPNSSCSAGVNDFAVSDPRLNVNVFNFYVRGVGINDGIQPEVILVIRGTVALQGNQQPVSFTLQTTASQRGIDL